MLEGISWSQYGAVVIAGLIIYYLYIFLRYRGNRGEQIAPPTARYVPPQQPAEAHVDADAYPEEPLITDELFDRAAALITALREYISGTEVGGMSREELSAELSRIIAQFPEVNHPSLFPGVNDHIVQALKEHGSIMLDERELDRLWY